MSELLKPGFRYNIPELAKKYKVYAVDLLGFGWSEKALVEYDATIWMEQVSDFLREVVKSPSVLVGNRCLPPALSETHILQSLVRAALFLGMLLKSRRAVVSA